MKNLKIHFDPNQLHQIQAVQSIVDLFDGLARQDTTFALSGDIISNLPEDEFLDETWLEENLRAVQQRNVTDKAGSSLDISMHLEVDDGLVLEGAGWDSVRAPHFTIEMETGTGKTYAYFRTIRELYHRYGLRKFVVVVPSVAIFEGVKKTYQMTKDHFATLFGNDPIELIEYDGSQPGRIRNFAVGQFISVLVITRDAFNKVSNNFYKTTEKLPGELKPYQYVQATRPVVILDEPQNMESERSKEAIRTLKPLCVLRYSATHRDTPNLVYRLTPVDAFRQGLVKQIEVIGITQLGNLDAPLLALEEIKREGRGAAGISARVRSLVLKNGRTSEQVVTLKQGDDLFKKTQNEAHRGYEVGEIKIGKEGAPDMVIFTNGQKVSTSDEILGSRREVFKAQIERTIEEHLQRQELLRPHGVKVLSLFFIDHVKNYIGEDGFIRKLFDEAFERMKRRSPHFANQEPYEVRSHYFAKRKGKKGELEDADPEDLGKDKERAEREAYQLIMCDKEKLLSLDEPVAFIFAHSALKEGWDNPNVFQICTLNQTVSTVKKRQEIGRGLRLCVDQSGRRPDNTSWNVLTVIANESYENYVANLQREYVDDGIEAPPTPKKPEQGLITRRNNLFTSAHFRDFWNKLRQQLHYTIQVDTPTLVTECVARLRDAKFPEPMITITRGTFVMKDFNFRLEKVVGEVAHIRVRMKDTQGGEKDVVIPTPLRYNLEKELPALKGSRFILSKIAQAGGEWHAYFANGEKISQILSVNFRPERPEEGQTRQIVQQATNCHPVFDFIGRAVAETGLTRATMIEIFRSLDEPIKEKLFKNPEGWANVFVEAVREATAEHVVERLDFHTPHGGTLDAEELFPETEKIPQHELIDAGPRGLYDRVQVDSIVEQAFVKVVHDDQDAVVLYFKFPPKFKLFFPRVIGNYNPDWGIIRQADDGGLSLQLVRETKGNEDLSKLRFTSEGRKLRAAQKYFAKLGINYRFVTDKSVDYWKSEEEVAEMQGRISGV